MSRPTLRPKLADRLHGTLRAREFAENQHVESQTRTPFRAGPPMAFNQENRGRIA
jgi:hypothetical protein